MRKFFALGLLILGASNVHAQWQLTGNAGTNPAIHFIGTTDNVDLIFRRGNIRSGFIGSLNTAFGLESLPNNTSGASNAAFGNYALRNNTQGSFNLAVGPYALSANTTGYQNTAVGGNALSGNTVGVSNTAIGTSSLSSNTGGRENTATGAFSLLYNTTGYNNTAMGIQALLLNDAGIYNTAIGSNSLANNTSGYFNTAVGASTLLGNTGGWYNTALGYAADVNGGYTHATAIGALAVNTGSYQVRIGNSSVTSIGGYTGWTNFSDGRFKKDIQENVPGLAFIKQLKPVTYHLDISGVNAFLRPQPATDKDGKVIQLPAEDEAAIKQKEQVVYTGFVAQDVEAAAKKMNYAFSGVDAPKNEKDVYGLRYAEFVVPLVKAVQELSAENDKLQSSLTAMQAQISELSQQLRELKGEAQNPASLKIYPNPASQSFIIETRQELKGAVIQLFDMSGKAQPVTVKTINAMSREVQMPSLSKGLYVVKVINGGQTATGTVTIQ